MKRSARAWTLFAATRVVGLAADVCAVGAAYYGAILLRFDLRAPRWGWTAVLTSFSVVALVHVVALVFSEPVTNVTTECFSIRRDVREAHGKAGVAGLRGLDGVD